MTQNWQNRLPTANYREKTASNIVGESETQLRTKLLMRLNTNGRDTIISKKGKGQTPNQAPET